MALYVSVLRNDLCRRVCSPKQTRKRNTIILISYRKKRRNCYGDFPQIMREVCENGAYFH